MFIAGNLRFLRRVYCKFAAVMTLYALKIQGKAKIPDYVQLRDHDFTLLAYFRLDRPEKALLKAGLAEAETTILEFISRIPFGKVEKIEI